jgi:hypothetical protein
MVAAALVGLADFRLEGVAFRTVRRARFFTVVLIETSDAPCSILTRNVSSNLPACYRTMCGRSLRRLLARSLPLKSRYNSQESPREVLSCPYTTTSATAARSPLEMVLTLADHDKERITCPYCGKQECGTGSGSVLCRDRQEELTVFDRRLSNKDWIATSITAVLRGMVSNM